MAAMHEDCVQIAIETGFSRGKVTVAKIAKPYNCVNSHIHSNQMYISYNNHVVKIKQSLENQTQKA